MMPALLGMPQGAEWLVILAIVVLTNSTPWRRLVTVG